MWARCSPPVSRWELLDCSIKLRKCELRSVSQALYQGQSEHSINIEVKLWGRLADISMPSVCTVPLNVLCGFILLITDSWFIMLCTWVSVNICFQGVRRTRLKHFFAHLSGSGLTLTLCPGGK